MQTKSKHIAFLIVIAIAVTFAGCARDPKVRAEKYLRSGVHFFDQGDYQSASIQLRRALQENPGSSEAHYRLALTYLHLLQWQDAYKELRQSIAVDANFVPAHLELAALEVAARQTSSARQEIECVLKTDSNNAEAHLLLGQIALSEKDYGQALREFEVVQSVAPKDAIAFVRAGDTYVLMNRRDEAIQAFDKAIQADASYVPAYLDLAQTYRLEGDYKSEVGTLDDAIQHNPKQIALYLAKAEVHVRQRQNAQIPALFSQLRNATADAPTALLAIGEFYFGIGDALGAEAAFKDALAKDKKNSTIRKRLVELYLNQHNWDEAERLNGEILKSSPRDPLGRLFQARLQFVRGAKAEATSSLEQLVHDNPEMALARFYLGLAYADRGQPPRAIAALNDTVQRDPNFIWAYLGLAELYAQQGSPKLALDFAGQALAHSHDFVPAILLQANAYMQLRDYKTATSKLEAISSSQQRNPAVLERLAVAAIYQKQYQQAEKQLEASLAAQPDYVPAVVDLAKLYSLEKRPTSEIIDRVQQQIIRAPKQAALYELLGQIYMVREDFGAAQQAFENSLNLNENATEARVQLAQLFARQGKLSEAIHNAQTLIDKHPDLPSAYLLLGSFYEQTGAVSEAEQAYQQALQKNEDFAPALNNLAWLYCEHGGNLDLALGLAQRAKAKMPTAASVSDTLAWIQYRKGLYSSAAAILKDVIQQSPQNATYQYHFGMTLWKEGKASQAKEQLRRALQLHLASDQAQEATNVLATLNKTL